MLHWNKKAIRLAPGSHVTSFNQLGCFISSLQSMLLFKFVYDIGSLAQIHETNTYTC